MKIFVLFFIFLASFQVNFSQELLCIGDADTQSDNATHTKPEINLSRYNLVILSFSLNNVKPGVYNADLSLNFKDLKSDLPLTIYSADNQNWKEGEGLPKDDLEIMSGNFLLSSGKIKLPKLEIPANQKQLVLVIAADTDNWNRLSSRTGSAAPKLTLLGASTERAAVNTETKKSKLKIGTNFWFLADWSGETPFVKSVNFEKSFKSGENIWNSEFLKDLEPFAMLRFMDWGGTNNSKVRAWSERKLPTNQSNSSTDYIAADSEIRAGLAYEWMIDLCNRTKKDAWICIPHLANDEYIRELAKLVKSRLSPQLKVFIEYSNETWNGSFTQFDYTLAEGQRLKLPGDNKWYQGGAFSIYRSFQIFGIFDEVFGASNKSQVKRVLAFSGNFDIFFQSYKSLSQNTSFNPKAIIPDYLAVAPYIGAELDGGDANIVEKWAKEVRKTLRDYVIPANKIARQLGIPLISYEGGQHLLTHADIWSKNPAIYEGYALMLNEFSPYFEIFNHYTLAGVWNNGGAWGAMEKTGMRDSPKYRALKDFAK